MANVFNTFSFNKWADTKKEEEIDKESKKRRQQQIKRLKEKLRKERELRESGAGGDGDVDLEALIEALQSGDAIHADANPFDNWHNGRYVAGTMKVQTEGTKGRTASTVAVPDSAYSNSKGAIELPDDYILEEIRRYKTGSAPPSRVSSTVSEPSIVSETGSSRLSSATEKRHSDDDRLRWQYNRRIAAIRDSSTHSLPPSRSPSARPSSHKRISSGRPSRTHSAERFNHNRYEHRN